MNQNKIPRIAIFSEHRKLSLQFEVISCSLVHRLRYISSDQVSHTLKQFRDGVGKTAQQVDKCLIAVLTRLVYPQNPSWEERTNSRKLSSDFYMCKINP